MPSQLTGSPGRVFQAGFGWAMVQPELWAAAALMLLGAAVSLCLKCQLSGKFYPRAPGSCPPPWLGFPLGMSPPPQCGFGSAQPWSSFALVGMLPELERGRGSARERQGKQHPNCSTPSLGWVQRCGLQTPPRAHRGGCLWDSTREDQLQLHKSCRGSGTEGQAWKGSLEDKFL